MPTETGPHLELDIAHVLFVDVVGYSKLLIDEQRALLDELNHVIRSTAEFRKAEAQEKLIRLPTGDGMALVFFNTPEAPVRCALEISAALAGQSRLKLRMGINTGPISGTLDVNDRSNIAGLGINMAKRVMDCGDAGHVLLSKRTADDLAQNSYWRPYLHELGPCEVKHGVAVELVNFYNDTAGNAAIPEQLRQQQRRRIRSRRARLAFAFVALLAIGAAVFAALFFRGKSTSALEKSIAVLPFANLSDNPENEFFAGGIQDDVLTNLAKLGDLKVIARTSVAKYKGTDMTAHQIGKALGVGAVLEGSVRRVGNRVRVNAQLIDTRNDAHIWAEQYERDLTDVFAIQSDLALQIAAALHTSLSPDERARLEKRPTDDPEAYLTYLQARDEVSKGPQSIEELERIAQLYEKAIQLDPSFALAFAQLSYISATIYQAKNEPAALAGARATASEALRLQPHLPEAHLALGYVYYRGDRDYERALSELAIAKQGLPNDPEVFLVTGSIERRQGRWKESTADFEKAASVNPKDPFLWNNLGTNYQALRDFPAAAKTFARGVEADPSFFPNHYMRARMEIDWNGDTAPLEQLLQQTPAPSDPDGKIAFAQFELKLLQRRYAEALQLVEASPHESFFQWRPGVPFPKSYLAGEACRLMNDQGKARVLFEQARRTVETTIPVNPGDASRPALLGQIYAGLGLKPEAIREGEQAVELLPESKDALDGPAMTLVLAKICVVVGEYDRAVTLLEHSLSSPGGATPFTLQTDPIWDAVRANPRFQQLLSSPPVFNPTKLNPNQETNHG